MRNLNPSFCGITSLLIAISFSVSFVQAQCSPAVTNGATVFCTGIETNPQGTSNETNVTINVGGVSAGTIDVTGTTIPAISLADGAIVNIEANGQIDADMTRVIDIQGSGNFTNDGTINFGDTSGSVIQFSGGGGIANVMATNNGHYHRR